MNKIHHYKNYKSRAAKKFLVSYHVTLESGEQGYGHMDFYTSERIGVKTISEHLKKEHGYKTVIVLGITPI